MSSQPDLAAHFRAMEALVEAQPEGINVQIAHGVYLMSPRSGGRHAATQVKLASRLEEALGRPKGSEQPDWLFMIEPEIRSETAFSRVIPDIAGWRRSTCGWPNLDETPISLPPEWVGEILSKSTEAFDRGEKTEAYGLMGVGWLWLVDTRRHTVATFENERGRLNAGIIRRLGDPISAPPFENLTARADEIFLL